MSTRPVCRDELEYAGLFLRQSVADGHRSLHERNARMAVAFLRLLDAPDCVGMRHVVAAAEGVEIFAPFRRDRIRIAQVMFVEFFHKRGVAAGKL